MEQKLKEQVKKSTDIILQKVIEQYAEPMKELGHPVIDKRAAVMSFLAATLEDKLGIEHTINSMDIIIEMMGAAYDFGMYMESEDGHSA